MTRLYKQCMRERYGYEVFERDYGFITYSVTDDTCSAIEYFIEEGSRGVGVRMWKDFVEHVRNLGVKQILGFVDTRLSDPTKRLKAYFRYGARIKGISEDVIVIVWEV